MATMNEIPFTSFELICLGSSVAFSGLFYYLYRKRAKALEKIKTAPKMYLDEQLIAILDSTPGKCLQYAVIEGVVRPIGQPLQSQYHGHLNGVLQRLLLKERRLIWNSVARSWSENESILHEHVNMVPFELISQNGGHASVRVVNPLQASGLHLETVFEKFHQPNHDFKDLLSHYLTGEKPKGILETEELIKVGASLTGIGELVLDSDKVVKLQPPKNGSEYFLTLADYQTLVDDQSSVMNFWKILTIACGLIGAVVVLVVLRRVYHLFKEQQELEERRREFEQMRQGRDDQHFLNEDDEIPENACIICLSNPRQCVLLGCGHVCCCFDCYQALPSRTCPICRCAIERVVPLYQA
ncbi:mitochondrial ubiquitin ligase activator of nfkb 1-A-like isoform X2 [Protopterus annectens]|nr:mitochondrial ubiquitin ligase activator of nfkb 1-A-like isoform X2 [Protopterus annectens]XP_043926571.1 mitochondrial ubiquitin ligase activator of nfkb 1-A-like isoform X2 [Protopterus annectens]XP_043926572.1 mitochondrial ubiquitin ligase activator of nfkb 1-A-like isoform X2 [Protopterus annectens]XP_043926574.1 mitochondrial ubiquitin ligase activator of nfkb 1-A-like isoform X2 [Protopterus annectens]